MPNESLSRGLRLQHVLAAYLQDASAGKDPDRDKLLTQHPDLAEDLQRGESQRRCAAASAGGARQRSS